MILNHSAPYNTKAKDFAAQLRHSKNRIMSYFHIWKLTGIWFSSSRMHVRLYGLYRKLRAEELMLLNCGVGEDS